MKNIFSLFIFIFFCVNQSVAQVFPFVDDFSTQTNLTLVRAPWKTKNFNVYARGTGTPASLAVQSGLSTFGRFDSLISPIIGPITSTAQLTFNYRIVQYIGSTATTVTMVAADNFNVGISTNGGTTWTPLSQLPAGTTTAFLPKTISLASYAGQNVKIRFYCERATSATSDYTFHVDDFAVQGIVSTENRVAESSQLLVFPNPVQGVINLKIVNIEEEATATLSDLTGKTVLTQVISLKNDEVTSISLKNAVETVLTGNYILSIATKNGIFTKKITISE